jgi:manganese transport protein
MAVLTPARVALRRPGWPALLGPAFAVSIGYVDPGNWASDLAAGAYGFRLLWVILAANAVAVVLQIAVTRVTIASGEDLATMIARRWARFRIAFLVAFQGAIIATDLAEFTGIVLGMQLLFRLSLAWSIGIGLAIVWSLLVVTTPRLRLFQVAMLAAIGGIALAFVQLIGVMKPSASAVAQGAFVPVIPDAAAVLIIVAIIGATVMPHNLFLHSFLVKRRCEDLDLDERRKCEKFFTRETIIALNLAALINGAILIVGASLHGHPASVGDAFAALVPAGGISLSQLFGAALLVSGIAASACATMSGDSIVKAFSPIPIPAAARRAIAVFPAAGLLLAHVDPTQLLLWSQMGLCLMLPVALVPLLAILYRTEVDGSRASGRFFLACAFATGLCVALDLTMLVQNLSFPVAQR